MEIIATEGMWLTQAHIENENERGFWKRLYPAKSLTKDDFVEWSDTEKEKWEKEEMPVEEVEEINE